MNFSVMQQMLRLHILLILLFPASDLMAQRVTPVERQALRELKTKVDQIGRLQRSNRGDQALDSFEVARRDLAQLAGGARPELAQQLLPEYQRLAKIWETLKGQQDSLPPLTPWEELLQQIDDPVSFRSDVAPIIVAKCGNCHVDRSRGNFSAGTFEALDRSTKIAYGLPNDSRLIEVIVNGEMPQGGLQVTEEELEILKRWIRQGAKFDGTDRNQNLRQLARGEADTPVPPPAVSAPTGNETVSFGLQIAPLLIENCGQCHMVNNPRGNFSQANFESLLRGGGAGNTVVPGKAESSLLFQRINAGEMPPTGKLPQSSIDLIKTWINEGAKFDGNSPRLPLTSVAAIAKAGSQSHAELSDDRAKMGADHWKLVMDRIEPVQLKTPNLRIFGTLEQSKLEELGNLIEQDLSKILSLLKADTSQPAVKGNVSVFVFDKRYDFGEFGKMIEGRDLPRDTAIVGNHTVTDTYLALLLTRNQTPAELQPSLAEQMAALHVAQLAGDVPRWFSEGLGSWVLTRLHSKTEQAKSLENESLNALAKLNNPADLFSGRLDQQQTKLLGYQMIKGLKKKSANFDRLLQMLRSGKSFEDSFRSIYGYRVEEIFQQKW